MENLEIKNKPFSSIRFGLGIFMIVVAVTWLLFFINSRKVFDIVFCLFFIFYGLYNLTNGFGIESSWILISDDGIKIKWMDRIRTVSIKDTVIEKISLGRSYIMIIRKSGKALKLKLGFMEISDKRKVYDFFVEYGSARSLVVLREYDE